MSFDTVPPCWCGHWELDHTLESGAVVDGRDLYLCLECPGYVREDDGRTLDGYPDGTAWHMYEEEEPRL